MTYNEALRNETRKPIYKIEWLDSNENVIAEVTTDMLSGNLSIEHKNGKRRACNLIIENNDLRYVPNKNGLIYIDKKLRLYTGLYYDGNFEYKSQGIFNLSNPILSSKRADKTIQIESFDNWLLFEKKLKTDYIINVGELITDVVSNIFIEANISTTPIIYPSTEILPYTIIKSAGSTLSELLLELADVLSWEVFFDNNGRGRFQPPIDTVSTKEIWTFGINEVTYLGGETNYGYDSVRNSIVIYGENINGDLIIATAQDTDILSPTNINKIGEIPEIITDNNIYSQELAQDRANYELNNLNKIYQNVNFTCIPIDIIKEGDIIIIDDINNGNNRDKFIVKSISYPIGYNQQQNITALKIM